MDEKIQNRLITTLSITIPVVVVILFGVKLNVKPLGFLPPIYATTNGLTAIILIMAVVAIKNNNRKRHKLLMKVCIVLSLAFLAMYVAYHMTSDPTPYGGEGLLKYIYYFILITHIVLSVVVIPLVLISYSKAFSEKFDKHKKIAKIAFPIWLYVAVTGVIVYVMIAPYYNY